MAYHAWLTFQNTGIARGLLAEPGGVGARAGLPIFLQIGEPHHIPGNAHQVVSGHIRGELTHTGVERPQAQLHHRLRIAFNRLIQGENIADPRMIVFMVRGYGQQWLMGSGSSPYGRRAPACA
jgi:hypothetical protein